MKKPISILLLVLWVIPACKKNALPVAGGNTLNKTVQTISGTSSSQFIDSFVYDGQQRLAEVISSGNSSSVADTVTLQYDASGRVVSWTMSGTGLGQVISYELLYDGNGRLVKAMAVPLLTNYAFSDYSFAYDAQGRLATDTVFAQHLVGIPSTGILSYVSWTYDNNGNAIADAAFFSSNSNHIGAPFTAGVTDEYRYDSRINPYYHAGIPFYSYGFGVGPQLLSPNNLVGGTTSDTSAVSPYAYSYDYYSNGRPREQKAAWSAASETITQTNVFFYQ